MNPTKVTPPCACKINYCTGFFFQKPSTKHVHVNIVVGKSQAG